MPGGDEITELRALQERAYGRAGSLSPADAARLRQLEFEVDEEAPPVVSANALIETGDDDDLSPADGAADAAADTGTVPPQASVLRTRWKLLAAVLLLAILVGLILGWALFSPRAPQAVHLDAVQLSWQEEILVSGKYDPGSVRAIAEEDGTIVWFATRDGGDTVCAIIGDGITTSPACRSRELALMQGLQTSLRREVEGGEGQVDAQIQFDAEGDPAVLTSNHLIGAGAGDRVWAQEGDQAAAERLAEQGIMPFSLQIVGRDGDTPVWFGVDARSNQWCLIYDGSSLPLESTCEDVEEAGADGGTLILDHRDPAGATTTFVYVYGQEASYLQITRSADDAGS